MSIEEEDNSMIKKTSLSSCRISTTDYDKGSNSKHIDLSLNDDEKQNKEEVLFHFEDLKVFSKDKNLFEKAKYAFDVGFSMFSGRWFSMSIVKNLNTNPVEAYDRLMQEWTNISIVSALMLTLVYNSFYSTAENLTLSVITFVCSCCFMLSITVSILFMMGIGTIPKQYSVQFAKEFSMYLTVPEFFTVVGMYLFSIQSVWFGYIQFGSIYLACGLPFCCVLVAIALYIWTIIIFILDRKGGIWEASNNKVY